MTKLDTSATITVSGGPAADQLGVGGCAYRCDQCQQMFLDWDGYEAHLAAPAVSCSWVA